MGRVQLVRGAQIATRPSRFAFIQHAFGLGIPYLEMTVDEWAGRVRLEVRLEGETVWLSLTQMAELFGRDKSVISRHLWGVFESGELHRKAVVAESATTAADGKTYQVEYFNLDAVLSVGYRVNSKRGTQFRIWATGKLREHLLRGYTLNERRLAEAPRHPRKPTGRLALESARSAIGSLRLAVAAGGSAPGLFGQERGDQLGAILGNVEQTFDGVPLYPSVQTRAAHLLYFLIKDHPFSDGNKRIGTLLFLEYLRRNGMLVRADGAFRLADNTMVALALLVAESEPNQKDLMIRLVLSLLEDGQ